MSCGSVGIVRSRLLASRRLVPGGRSDPLRKGLRVTNSRDKILQLSADRATPVEEGSYRWQGELRLWDNEALLGWYRSTDAAVRSKGTLYLSLHPHGNHAWGRWVGMSYDGLVITGWGALARTQEHAAQVVQDHVDQDSR